MREYSRNGKPVIHQSNLKEFLLCPKKYKLSIEKETETTEAQNLGLLTEGYLWGFKENNQEDLELGGRKKMTDARLRDVENCKRCAELVAPKFEAGGTPFVKIEYEHDLFILQGEIDYHGVTKLQDLKTTGDMNKVWAFMDWRGETIHPTKEDLLQSIFYPYILWKNTEIIFPFEYIIIDLYYHVIKSIVVEAKYRSFNWLENILINFISDPFFDANPKHENCLKNKYGAKCPYLQFCHEGLEYYKGGINQINFDNLT